MNIKETAREMIRKNGLINLSRADLSATLGIPDGSFPHIAGYSFNDLVRELQADEKLMAQQPPVDQEVSRSRVRPELRREHILAVAVRLAKTRGYQNLSRAVVAESAGVSDTLVSHYFKTMAQLRIDIMTEAVRTGVIEVIAQGLSAGDEVARGASEEVKRAAVDSLL